MITRLFITLYWVVLIGLNIYNCKQTKKKNAWIIALIIVNAIVIVLTALGV